MSKGKETTSNLTIKETTHGVSAEGIEDLLKDIKQALTIELKNNIKDYGHLVEVINENWTGDDARRWCEQFVSMADNIANNLDSYYNQIETEFRKIYDEWEKFQSCNVKPGK